MSDFYKKVATIQSTLKAPKSQRNTFGNYNYRNAEDIMEAVKPLLGELVLTVNDELVSTPNGNYIKSTAIITDGIKVISNSALAREAMDSKGMSPSQMTGSTSSYARKYALNGLFLIDDTRDDDATNTHGKDDKAAQKATPASVVDKEKLSHAIKNPLAMASGIIDTASVGASSAVKPSFRRPVRTPAVTATTTSGDDL